MEGNVEVIASGVSSPSVPSSTLPFPVSSPGPGAAGFSGGAGDPKTYRRGYPWFDDGNTFLVAEQTSFKVHRGVLAKHSEVFQGLFRIPQPVDAEQHDGIPVINMTDKPGDLAVFLAALYDGPRFVRCAKLKFKDVVILTRLGHKYGVQQLCEGGLRRLREAFPPAHYPPPGWHETPEKGLPGFRTEDAITVANLARLTGATDILPTVLYVCTQLSVNTILSRSCLIPGSNNEDYLSMDDVARCLSGQSELRLRQLRTVLKVASRGLRSDRCKNAEKCHTGLATIRQQAIDMLASPSSLTADVDTLRVDTLWDFVGSFDLCEPCHSDIRIHALRQMRLAFDDLPAIFNLEHPTSQQ